MKIFDKKLHGLDKYVVFSIAIVLIYTVAEMILSTVTAFAHDTLTACVYGFFAGEVVTCALIKIFKLKEQNNDEGGGTIGFG